MEWYCVHIEHIRVALPMSVTFRNMLIKEYNALGQPDNSGISQNSCQWQLFVLLRARSIRCTQRLPELLGRLRGSRAEESGGYGSSNLVAFAELTPQFARDQKKEK